MKKVLSTVIGLSMALGVGAQEKVLTMEEAIVGYHLYPRAKYTVWQPNSDNLTFLEAAGLTGESAETGRRLGIDLPDNLPAANLRIIDKLDPNTTASMQKDLARGHESEIEGLLFQMLDLGEKMGVYMKTYRHVADTLINRLSVDSRKAREARSIVCSLEWI